MGMGGSLARMFTTLKELGPKDPQMAVYGLAALLNVALFAQASCGWGGGTRCYRISTHSFTQHKMADDMVLRRHATRRGRQEKAAGCQGVGAGACDEGGGEKDEEGGLI